MYKPLRPLLMELRAGLGSGFIGDSLKEIE